ncbi:glycosyltransferase [Aliidiomarina celeris]|uniref:glycosyltransferase n=1 Tax=Aliidiomarina celeris TaxID=2249428 RepID=UPI0018E620D5|nr:glycosyltransferase [Aliidiomarina celeris]
MNFAPILLFTYNRLETTQQCIDSLLACDGASETDIVIFSDGPKNEQDAIKVAEVRKYLKELVGFRNVDIHFSEENKGLAGSIIQGVTSIFTKKEMAIVVEDDLLVSNDFLIFMNKALEFYKRDLNILSICGYSPNLRKLNPSDDVYFGKRSSSWGWATWVDRWREIDWTAPNAKKHLEDKVWRKKFAKVGSDMPRMLQNQLDGKINSWAIRFCYHQFNRNLASVFPVKSKVCNVGFNNDATHTKTPLGKAFNCALERNYDFNYTFFNFKGFCPDVVGEFASLYSFKARALKKMKELVIKWRASCGF